MSPCMEVFISLRAAHLIQERNLILAMNRGNADGSDDGFVSLINPDGSVHTSKWIGANRDGLELRDPIGSAISNGVLYTADNGSREVKII